jgi:selenoprotein W-related protein
VGGIFEVRLNDEPITSRAIDGGFIELKEIKQRLRNRIAPDKPLGHSDRR